MMFSSIRTKFLVVLLPLFLICFIALSGISYYVSNNALVSNADEYARAVAGQAAKELEGKGISARVLDMHTIKRSGKGNTPE